MAEYCWKAIFCSIAAYTEGKTKQDEFVKKAANFVQYAKKLEFKSLL